MTMGTTYRLAVIANGIVENVILGDADFAIEEKILIRLSEVDDDGLDTKRIIDEGKPYPGIGWAYDGNDFTHPDDVAKSAEGLKAYSATYRRSYENAGITWEGDTVGTSRDDQLFFAEVRMRAAQSPDGLISFKTKSGKFITQTLTQFLPIAEAVYKHVQDGFRIEAIVYGKIDDGSVTTIKQVEEAFDMQKI